MPRVYNGSNTGDRHTQGIAVLGTGPRRMSGAMLINVRDTARSTPLAIDCASGNGNMFLNVDMNSTAGRIGIVRNGSGTAQQRYAATDSLGSGVAYRNKGWHWVFFTIDETDMTAARIAIFVDSSTECSYGTGLDANGSGTLFGSNGTVSIGFRDRTDSGGTADRWFNGQSAYVTLWDNYKLTTADIDAMLAGTSPASIQTAAISFHKSAASSNTPETTTGASPTITVTGSPILRASTYLPIMRALTSGTPVAGIVAYLDAASLAYSDDATTPITDTGNLQRWDCEFGGSSGLANTAAFYMATSAYKPKWYAATATRNAYVHLGCEPNEGYTYPSAVGGMLRNAAAAFNLSARAHTVLLIGAAEKPCGTGVGGEWMWDQTLLGAADFNVGIEGSQDNGSGANEYGYMGGSGVGGATAWANTETPYVVGNLVSNRGRAWYCTANHTSGPLTITAAVGEPGKGSDYNAYWSCKGAWASGASKVVPPCTPTALMWRATADTTIKVQRGSETAVSVTRATEAAGSATNAAFTLGGTADFALGSGNGYQYPGGFLAHAVVVWNRALTDAEATAVIAALAPYYNAVLAPTTVVGVEASSSGAGYYRTGGRNILWDSPQMGSTRWGFIFARGGDDSLSGGGADIDLAAQTGPVDSIATLTSDVRIFVQQDSNGLVAALADGAADTVNPGNIITALTTWTANRRTAGYDKVYAVPVLSRTCANIPLFNTRRRILNNSLVALAGTTFDRVVPLHNDAVLYADDAYLGPNWLDAVHMGDPGFALAQPYYDNTLAADIVGPRGSWGDRDFRSRPWIRP